MIYLVSKETPPFHHVKKPQLVSRSLVVGTIIGSGFYQGLGRPEAFLAGLFIGSMGTAVASYRRELQAHWKWYSQQSKS